MAAARELQVQVANEPGALGIVSRLLGQAGINIDGFGVWLGTARILVDDVDTARELLQEEGFVCQVREVLRLDLPDEPGNLAEVAREIGREGINIEHAYTVTPRNPGAAAFVLAVLDLEAAEEILD